MFEICKGAHMITFGGRKGYAVNTYRFQKQIHEELINKPGCEFVLTFNTNIKNKHWFVTLYTQQTKNLI